MKLRITNYSPDMVLTVSGVLQEIAIIKEDSGCLVLELLGESPAITANDAVTESDEINLPTVPVFEGEGTDEGTAKEDDAVVAYSRNNTLFHKLSDLRRTFANAEKVPPYLIFHDKTLWSMVEKLPVDLPSLGNISGVGKSKLEKYGAAFLEAIQEASIAAS